MKPAVIMKCLMCFGTDQETQERLKDRIPVKGCGLCRGLGKIEVFTRKGLDGNELRTTGTKGESGFFKVFVAPSAFPGHP